MLSFWFMMFRNPRSYLRFDFELSWAEPRFPRCLTESEIFCVISAWTRVLGLLFSIIFSLDFWWYQFRIHDSMKTELLLLLLLSSCMRSLFIRKIESIDEHELVPSCWISCSGPESNWRIFSWLFVVVPCKIGNIFISCEYLDLLLVICIIVFCF